MHEISITQNIIDIIKKEMKKNNLKRLKNVRIRVGKLTSIEPHSLIFCFDIATKETPFEGAVIDIEEVPLTGRCKGCNKEFEVERFLFICPVCKGSSINMLSGNELEIVSIDAE